MDLFIARSGGSEAVNRWHAEHPAALGVVALLFGLMAIFAGAHTLATGKKDRGNKQVLDDADTGMRACLSLAFGICSVLFGIVRLIYAAF
ncbi:hypothetical protein LOC68_27525 [Blastopirellula sp. JC732]|uniref:Uncharacterized protein n=1 Tax=Blastopirellula sediminis TaxID=2894196 RepID=A0A9X1MRE6_9BACT|nr:hypothetical protein [Blastopirellula sediminis]MCC9604538.1 hypothetical protein [Blastopirellula sediminis]MCC9632163.1 hypothetical protein [Blastopirellula sediminis]